MNNGSLEQETGFRQFQVLKTIDDILDRVYPVQPPSLVLTGPLSKKDQYELKKLKALGSAQTQYLFLADTKNSFESELVAWSTTLSDPIFLVEGWEKHFPNAPSLHPELFLPYYEVRPFSFVPESGELRKVDNPSTVYLKGTKTPAPLPSMGRIPFRVSHHLWNSLHGLRAVLLVLIDSCAQCARDEDYIGQLPAKDSLWALYRMQQWSEADFVPNAKYWKDWPLARFLRNDPPPVPLSWEFSPDEPLFAGKTGQYYRRLANYNSSRPDSAPVFRAVFGLAQSKRGFAQVPVSFVDRSLAKHARQLSTPPATVLGEDGFSPELATLFARTFFKHFVFPDTFLQIVRTEASTAASVYSTRSEGGTRSALRSELSSMFSTGAHVSHQQDFETPGEHTTSHLSEGLEAYKTLSYTNEKEYFQGFREFSPGQVAEERGTHPISEEEWRLLAKFWVSERPTFARLPLRYHTAFNTLSCVDAGKGFVQTEWLPNELRHKSFASVATVLEPLKVRTITAMDPVFSHLSRPLQKALWTYLRECPQFSLIGEPISEDILHDLNTRTRKMSKSLGIDLSDAGFVSGDYSAATDGLDIRLSKIFLEVLMEKLPLEDAVLRDVFRATLLEQVILYPKDSQELPIHQKNGQLMGSVLSFPFLCLANLFAYILALGKGDTARTKELLTDLRTMRRLPVLINGDDILFRADPLLYETWLGQIRRVGFEPSVGKNFYHKRFFTVNSVPIEFHPAPATNEEFWGKMSWADMADLATERPGYPSYRPDTLTDTFTIHGFLNVGLLTGQAKLTGRDTLRLLPISGWHAQSVLTSLNPAQAHNWFLHYHLATLKKQTQFGGTTLNIFAHPLKGGLGFVVPPGVEPRYSPEQRRLAEALFLSASSSFTGQEKEIDLAPLVSVVAPSTGAPLLATKRRRVDVELYPANTPLAPGRRVYEDRSQVPRKALTVAYSVSLPDEDGTQVKCRLSGRQIRSLTKRWGTHTVGLHPVESMEHFPFILVEVNRPGPNEIGPQLPWAIYSPEVPFQDVPTTLDVLEDELPFFSDTIPGEEPTRSEPTPGPLEDWETEGFALRPLRFFGNPEVEEITVVEPDSSFINRRHTGRDRRRNDLRTPNAFRPGSYQY